MCPPKIGRTVKPPARKLRQAPSSTFAAGLSTLPPHRRPEASAAPRGAGGDEPPNGIYYFAGTGSNDGYPKDDHVLVTDPFEKHVTRTMDALKKSVEHAGSNMDSLIHAQVFFCQPLADGVPVLTGKARFDAYKAQYDALNK